MMNDRQAMKWSVTRQKGKAKYVMLRGVLTWSIGLTALFTAIEWFSQQTVLTTWLTARFVVFGIIGFFVANFRWDSSERRYAQASEAAMAKADAARRKRSKGKRSS